MAGIAPRHPHSLLVSRLKMVAIFVLSYMFIKHRERKISPVCCIHVVNTFVSGSFKFPILFFFLRFFFYLTVSRSKKDQEQS